jgi:GDP-D-mannose dehydratase
LKKGWKVYGLVRKSTDISVLKEIQEQNKKSLTIVFADLNNFEALQKAIPNEVEVIFHVAACGKKIRF